MNKNEGLTMLNIDGTEECKNNNFWNENWL